ncbi:MAG: 2-C-methyl-D-erythritol 2,4-cyclodiphosphate synthase [Coriobacteriia bacterium]|nr:2-C-methyl-D-erythritol 2,4-cyclodiphosphate synthase [Coriobacteriia bacterium]
MRIGLGYDVHAFAQGRDLIIGGVTIPYGRGLAGHSDADVLLHAIADALLGALREGDIGRLFPDTDPQYEGADSGELLAQVAKRTWERGFKVIDIDCVIVAQEPRLSPYRDQMRANVAAILNIDDEDIGVKATTTEQLGFEGRGEGIAAYAVALLERSGSEPIPC